LVPLGTSKKVNSEKPAFFQFSRYSDMKSMAFKTQDVVV